MHHPDEHYDSGVAYHLARNAVPHVLSRTGVCVAEEFSAQFESAMREVDTYFWAIAYGLDNACEEKAFVEWATKEGLRFDVGHLHDLAGKVVGRVFHLRSFTQEQMVSNRRKLNEAPKGVACPAEGMIG